MYICQDLTHGFCLNKCSRIIVELYIFPFYLISLAPITSHNCQLLCAQTDFEHAAAWIYSIPYPAHGWDAGRLLPMPPRKLRGNVWKVRLKFNKQKGGATGLFYSTICSELLEFGRKPIWILPCKELYFRFFHVTIFWMKPAVNHCSSIAAHDASNTYII